MDALVLGFLVLGGVGLVLVLLGLVVGELGDLGGLDADGPFSLPALAAFVGGLGFAGAGTAALLPGEWPTAAVGLTAAAIGAGVALPLAYGALRFAAALHRMPTAATLTRGDLLGSHGVVVARVPAAGYGEVRLQVGGHQLKYSATSDAPLPAGTPVYVVDAPSDTSVHVVSTAP